MVAEYFQISGANYQHVMRLKENNNQSRLRHLRHGDRFAGSYEPHARAC